MPVAPTMLTDSSGNTLYSYGCDVLNDTLYGSVDRIIREVVARCLSKSIYLPTYHPLQMSLPPSSPTPQSRAPETPIANRLVSGHHDKQSRSHAGAPQPNTYWTSVSARSPPPRSVGVTRIRTWSVGALGTSGSRLCQEVFRVSTSRTPVTDR